MGRIGSPSWKQLPERVPRGLSMGIRGLRRTSYTWTSRTLATKGGVPRAPPDKS